MDPRVVEGSPKHLLSWQILYARLQPQVKEKRNGPAKNDIGIDMAKDSFVVNVYEQKECQKFDNTFEGFLKFKEFYKDILECSLKSIESVSGYQTQIRFM